MRKLAWFAVLLGACSGGGGGFFRFDGGARDMPGALDMPRGDGPFMASCTDRMRDGNESDIDCGGSCAPCRSGSKCVGNGDCESGLCVQLVCQAGGGSCTDRTRNGNETDIDCGGGSCPLCPDGFSCKLGTDCQSGTCANGRCSPAVSCFDNLKNGNETDVDCGGGTCPLCLDGLSCRIGTDCQSGTCANGRCSPAVSCFDNLKNGNETDVDCGGGSCSACSDLRMCRATSDCQSANCSISLCCPFGQGNCNGSSFDGCEVDLTSDRLNCGSCGHQCPNTAPSCVNSTCIGGGNFTHSDGEGDTWTDSVPTGTITQTQALAACAAYAANHGGITCKSSGCACGSDLCVYADNGTGGVFTWFYGGGGMSGTVTANCCGCASNAWN